MEYEVLLGITEDEATRTLVLIRPPECGPGSYRSGLKNNKITLRNVFNKNEFFMIGLVRKFGNDSLFSVDWPINVHGWGEEHHYLILEFSRSIKIIDSEEKFECASC